MSLWNYHMAWICDKLCASQKGNVMAVFYGRFLSPDVSVKLITSAGSCRSMSMGLEDIPCSSWSQGQLRWEHLLLLCFPPISSISDVTLLYWICLNVLEEEKKHAVGGHFSLLVWILLFSVQQYAHLNMPGGQKCWSPSISILYPSVVQNQNQKKKQKNKNQNPLLSSSSQNEELYSPSFRNSETLDIYIC